MKSPRPESLPVTSEPALGTITLFLVDDSPLLRAGLRAVLGDQPGLVVVGEAGTAADALRAIPTARPQVVLLDLQLPDDTGVNVCRALLQRLPELRVLILTSSSDERLVHSAITAGAHGYLLKENDGASLASAIRRVASGQSALDTTLTEKLFHALKRGLPSYSERLQTLSTQEKRVVALLSEGQTNKEIGQRLGLTEKTVKNYLANAFDKLGVTRRAQAAALYAQTPALPR